MGLLGNITYKTASGKGDENKNIYCHRCMDSRRLLLNQLFHWRNSHVGKKVRRCNKVFGGELFDDNIMYCKSGWSHEMMATDQKFWQQANSEI